MNTIITNETNKKLVRLKEILKETGSALIAYSGGVDSSFLLRIASEVLEDKLIAVTAFSDIYADGELANSKIFARLRGVEQIEIYNNPLDNELFTSNPLDRCYHCKKSFFSILLELSMKRSLNCVIDGTNADDISDYRPGMKAVEELGIRSPLMEAGLTKSEIRTLSRELNIWVWNKPAQPCYATRIPYGIRITSENISKVKNAEKIIGSLGISDSRVRYHNDIARIEVSRNDILLIQDEKNSEMIVKKFKELGFSYVTIDIEGYRMGSLNEIL